ncbi:MAG: hypothetical protein Q9180_002274, partial [Flavoplaca navasiana]
EEANGYTQSKIVGEQLVQSAADTYGSNNQEKSVRIVKPGYMIGNAETGVANQSDFLWRLVKGCIEIGAYDICAVRKWVFVGDVDLVADVVLKDLTESESKPREKDAPDVEGNESCDPVERVLCGMYLEDIWIILKDEFGYELQGLETDAWMMELTRSVEDGGEKHLLFPLLDTLEREGRTIGVEWQPTGSNDGRERALEAFRRNVEYLIKVGFLTASGAG